MTGWDPSLTRMREVLAYLYDDAASAKTIAVSAGLDSTKITFTVNASNIWQAILEQAVKSGKVENLVVIVQKDYPENGKFENAVSAYRIFREKQESESDAGNVDTIDDVDLYSHENLIRLQSILEDRFNLEDLQKLAFRLGIDYENIPGSTKSAKTRELVLYHERRRQLAKLVEVGQKLRPDIEWVLSG